MQCFDECIGQLHIHIMPWSIYNICAVKLADLANVLICLETGTAIDALVARPNGERSESVGTDSVLPCS